MVDALEKLPRAMLQSLRLTPPVPHEATEWCAGWCEKPTPNIVELRALRTDALGALLCHKNMGHECTVDAAQKLWAYAKKLAHFSKRACTIRRKWPLNFTWCFPGEVMSLGHNPCETNYRRTAVMRSCYPAFEALCVGVASTILTMRAIVEGRRTECANLKALETMFTENTNTILEWLPDIMTDRAAPQQQENAADTLIFSEAQWAGLCRQQLPIQLHRWWHEYSIAAFNHFCQLQETMRTSDDREKCAAYMRGAVQTSRASIERIRLGYHRCPTLNPAQVEILQNIYNITVSEYKRIEGQALVHDITHALKSKGGGAAISSTLLVSLRHCWSSLAKIGQPVSQEMEVWYAQAFRVASGASVTPCRVTQEDVDRWRAKLPTELVTNPTRE